MSTEDRLVKSLTRALNFKRAGENGAKLRLGIGDDAAIIAPGRNRDWVVSCDAFLEGIHFLPRTDPPDSVGYKCLVRATSDLAAMGAIPRFFFLTLALPARRTGKWFAWFLEGMAHASRLLQIQIAGGDTTRDSKVAISVTVLGEIAAGRAVKRSGARPGDLIFVTGRLGKAALGLELIQCRPGRSNHIRKLIEPHFYPRIQLELGVWLAHNRVASSMMDISDGLSTDLSRLCAASRVGARLNTKLIPFVELSAHQSRMLHKLIADPSLDLLPLALHGGDDYGLLFTVPRKLVARLRRAPQFSEITQIGEVVPGSGISIADPDGRARLLKPRGWDSFRTQSPKKSR
jgi:thiamine-monophosphate kinase